MESASAPPAVRFYRRWNRPVNVIFALRMKSPANSLNSRRFAPSGDYLIRRRQSLLTETPKPDDSTRPHPPFTNRPERSSL